MILSALLSAVTGAFAGTRPADPRLAQPAATQSVSVAAPSATVVAPAIRRVQEIPAQIRQVAPVPAPAVPLPVAPIETDRLLE